MEFLQLKYFTALAHQEHLTHTAQELMVTPSAISVSIARLEAELGVKLFDRVGRNIRLNDFGRAYLQYAEAVLHNVEDGALCIQEMKRAGESRLTLGVWNPQVWQRAIQAFHSVHPEIVIHQVTYDPVSSAFDLIQRGVDLLITSPDSFQDPRWEGTLLFNDKILLAVPPQHRLASRMSIDLREVRDERFVSTNLDTFSKRCYAMCEAAGFTMQVPIMCDYTLRPKIMASENLISFVTYHGTFTGNYANAHLVEITYPSDVRPQNIYWRKARYLSQTVRTAKAFFLEFYKDFTITL